MSFLNRHWIVELAENADRVIFRATSDVEGSQADLSRGAKAPDFWFEDEASSTSLRALEGRVVLLHKWSIWCVPCQEEMSALIRAYNTLDPRSVMFVGVNHHDPVEVAKNYSRETGLSWPQIYGEEAESVATDYRLDFLPGYALIGRDGRMVTRELRGEALIRALYELALEDEPNADAEDADNVD